MNANDPFVMSEGHYWRKSADEARYKDRMRNELVSIRMGVWAIFGAVVAVGILIGFR